MEKLFKVRVVSCEYPVWWYSKKIGEHFIVQTFKNENWWEVVSGDSLSEIHCEMLSKRDVEVVCEVVAKTTYEEVKRKVKLYRVMYKSNMRNDYFVTNGYYADAEDFYENGIDKCDSTFVQLIEDSMIEV